MGEGGRVHEKQIHRGELPKKGGVEEGGGGVGGVAWRVCRFKRGGDLAKKDICGGVDTPINTMNLTMALTVILVY